NTALVTTMAADLGHTTVFGTLCAGGTLHILGEDMARDAQSMSIYFASAAIDCMKTTPSHLKSILHVANTPDALPQHQLLLGGEASDYNLIHEIRRIRPECQIFNHYGPTETTVGCCVFELGEATEGPVPIGRPIANAQAYILNPELEPVPVGVGGELYIGGAGVARGYLNQPGMTGERFVPNPFGTEGGERLYRTGDRVRWREDGNLDYLGRMDEQVKIRGYRVEPGEIAAVLEEHAGVEQAVVTVGGKGGEKRLVAYYVGAAPQGEGREVEGKELRGYLEGKLPEYMV